MAQRILDIFRSSGDANVGQTLVRLAALAEAAHMHRAPGEAAAPAGDASNRSTRSRFAAPQNAAAPATAESEVVR